MPKESFELIESCVRIIIRQKNIYKFW